MSEQIIKVLHDRVLAAEAERDALRVLFDHVMAERAGVTREGESPVTSKEVALAVTILRSRPGESVDGYVVRRNSERATLLKLDQLRARCIELTSADVHERWERLEDEAIAKGVAELSDAIQASLTASLRDASPIEAIAATPPKPLDPVAQADATERFSG